VLVGTLMCKIRKIKIFDMYDLASIGFLIGQGIGRWGNFVNQEAYGGFTGSNWWGMESTRTILEMGEGLVHPCFLYESIWCLLGVFVLHTTSRNRKFSGEVALMYCVWYGFGRAIIELLRTDSLYLGVFKVSSLLSIIICISAAVLLLYLRSRYKETAHDGEYVEMFEPDEEDDDITEEISESIENTEEEENV